MTADFHAYAFRGRVIDRFEVKNDLNLASRVGPLSVMKDGSLFVLWFTPRGGGALKNANCGLSLGLEPPGAGFA